MGIRSSQSHTDESSSKIHKQLKCGLMLNKIQLFVANEHGERKEKKKYGRKKEL